MKNKVINLVTKGENDDYTLIMEALENYDELLHSESELIKAISIVAKKLGISIDGGKGYRTLANIGENGGQEVPHLHFHLFGERKLEKW